MALFSRSLKPEGDAGAPTANGDSGAESAPRHTIGDLLRDTRKSYGGDIDRIAATLRIRPSYLSAIEESQYAKLPGPVYAQGFVRAYAVHLGLDGDEAIRRFKQEVGTFEVTRDLSFPVPLAERSIPGGTMVLAALILALCGYGLWYYVSTSDRSHPERVSAVPPDLVAATKPPDATPPAAPPAAPTAAPGTAAPAAAQPGAPPAAATNTATPPAPALTPPATAVAAAPAATSAAPGSSPPGAGPSPATLQAAPGSATSASSAPAPAASPPAAAPTPSPAPPPTDATAAPPAPSRVYGEPPNVPVRIVVHAIKDSWVQLRSGDEVLIQHTLHPGDTVRVPDESGLSLRTGNGAGLQFEIDGKLFKPLSGTVRTVALDASRLAANNGGPPRTVDSNSGGPFRPGE